MTKAELIELLEDFDDDAEIRIMSQPSWPFEYSVQGVVACTDLKESDEDEVDDEQNCFKPQDADPEHVVYLVEGRQLGYGTKTAWQ